MPHQDCKYENGFCRNHFTVKEKSFQSLEHFSFFLETSKIIIDSGVFLLYPFFHLFLYIVIVSHRCHHCCVWCLFCPIFFISNWKTMDFLGPCFHFHSDKMYVGSFSKYTLSTGTASCELLMWNGKVYADGLQFKWFASFSCSQNFDSHHFEHVDDVATLSLSMLFNI